MSEQSEAIDEMLTSIALSDHLGDVCGAVRSFMKATGHPCPYHNEQYDMGECWLCGLPGMSKHDDEGNYVFTPAASNSGDA